MANVAILNEAGELLRYLRSAHTPDYLNEDGNPIANVLINPTQEALSALTKFVPPVVVRDEGITATASRDIFAYLKANGVDIGPAGADL